MSTEKVYLGRCVRVRATAGIYLIRARGPRVLSRPTKRRAAPARPALVRSWERHFQRRDASGAIALFERLLHMSVSQLCERLLHTPHATLSGAFGGRSAPARLEGQCRLSLRVVNVCYASSIITGRCDAHVCVVCVPFVGNLVSKPRRGIHSWITLRGCRPFFLSD